MTAGTEHLEQLGKWLEQERKTDRAQYEARLDRFSIKQRREQGITWYPVSKRKDYLGTGERLIVEVERMAGQEENHVLQSGGVVRWFVNTGDKKGNMPSVNAVINYIKGDKLVMTLQDDELPDWVFDGKLGIDLLFDEGTYRAMEEALRNTKKAAGTRLAELRELLAGKLQPRFDALQNWELPKLNESQNRALAHVLAAKDVGIIHGPPGTGKTTTLVVAVEQVVNLEKRTLVCAASNAAVDLLVDKLSAAGLKVLRLGHPARVTEEALQHTLDHQLTTLPEYKDLKDLRKRADEYRAMAYQYKRKFGPEERKQRSMLLRESKQMRNDARLLEEYLLDKVTAATQVFCSTLTGSNHSAIAEKKFGTVFIDEAAQALEPACWIPLGRAERVVLAGDHHQLPPTVKDFEVARAGFARTLFERLALDRGVGEMLEMQYRMHTQIMKFSSGYFYEDRLQAYEGVASATLGTEDPVSFVDTAGTGYEEKVDPETLSTGNEEEARLLLRLVQQRVETLTAEERGPIRIGIIAPYRAQVEHLNRLLEDYPTLTELGKQLNISTVDAFQGQERDLIAITLTRSNDKGEIGFLGDVRRMNVALTRAKRQLLVIGDSATLGTNPFYQAFLDYVQEIGAYYSAFEYFE
ncbi:MAG TPA: IGHMBP2 family helicase [Cytophagales bacterium]|nr:IGHMBP2 family helicase [Cytophagales bacterium]